jgi:WD40 repeat protein
MSIWGWEVLLSVIFLGGGGLLVVADLDGQEDTGSRRSTLRGHETLVESVSFGPDGKTIISCGWDKKLRVWDVDDEKTEWGREIENLPGASHLFSVKASPDGKYLAAGGVEGFHVWQRDEREGWKPIYQTKGASNRAICLADDSRTLAFGTVDGAIRIWDIPTQKTIMDLGGFGDELRNIDFSADRAYLAGTTFGGEFKIWELKSGNSPRLLNLDVDRVQSFIFTPDRPGMVIAEWGDRSKALSVWDLSTGKMVRRLTDHGAGSNALVTSPDGRLLASADVDESIRLWDMATGELLAYYHEGVGWVKTIAFSPDGRRIAYGGRDGTVRLLTPDLKPKRNQQNHF